MVTISRVKKCLIGYCGFFVIMPSVNDRQSFSNKERLLPNCVVYVDIVKVRKMKEIRFAIAQGNSSHHSINV